MAEKIVIIDYGVGNTFSVFNAIKELGYSVVISNESNEIESASALVLPGVGAFEVAMKNIETKGLKTILNKQVLENKKPILGICLGMQLMSTFSEENGKHSGLDWIKGEVVKLEASDDIQIPHVGWNNLQLIQREPLFLKTDSSPNFYFDHSFHYKCEEQFKLATCDYGQIITSAIRKDNILGVQFHPEKSQTNGLKLFRGFFESFLYSSKC